MAQCKLTPQEFIRNAFTPQIAVMCSPQAEQSCQKNNLSFIELLQPFAKLNHDIYYRDANNVVMTVKHMKLSFLDINARPPQTALARKYLNTSVSDSYDSKTQSITVRDRDIEIPSSTPWFEAWRETFLMVQYPSDHEYTKHFLACIIVVSSLDNKPAETMIKMAQTFNHIVSHSQGSLPKWFSSNVLKYHVIIHDNIDGDMEVALEAYNAIKTSFGAPNSFMLRMNSRPLDAIVTERLPDPWSQFLNTNVIPSQSATPTDTSDASPVSQRSSNVEVGQEVNEGEVETTYHPLSPANEDLSVFDSNLEEQSAKQPALQKQHGFCLLSEDVEQVKSLIYEFCKSALIPYIERQMQQLNESVSNKKGVSKSLFSATKRWFNPNKPGASAVPASNLTYVSDSPELQVRKLGDLYFMFANYTGAFQAYHNAKRDYNSDQAWLYYAGALEMASLAAFMANETNKKTCDYMEESILTYLNTCKMPQFATRATLLSTECLKDRGMYGEAAHQFIRMTSEDSDLRSALLLEQAAYCFLHSKMMRKYAFHMVLAGHRFSKAAQRRHSLRCYKQAHQVYDDSGWVLAEDHIHYTIGRQANNLQFYAEAVESFGELLKGESKQTPEQQSIFLKEYLTIVECHSRAADSFQRLQEEGSKQTEQKSVFLKNFLSHLENKFKKTGMKEDFILPVPYLDNDSTKLLTIPTAPVTTPGKIPAKGVTFDDDLESEDEIRWQKLEEMVVQEVHGNLPIIFKPSISLYTKAKLQNMTAVSIIYEPVRVSINLINNLKIPLTLKDVHLVWSFTCSRNEENISASSDQAEAEKYIKNHVLKSVSIPETSTKTVILVLSPLSTGTITVRGVSYTLMGSSSSVDTMSVRGKQLFDSGLDKNKQPLDNKSLMQFQVSVVPPAPCLQVLFPEINGEFLCDEIQRIPVNLQNTGAVPLDNVYMATSVPTMLSNCELKDNHIYTLDDCDGPAVREKLGRKNHVTRIPLPNQKMLPGQCHNVTLWMKAPDQKGSALIDLLIYYESSNKVSTPRYRLVRHSWKLAILESIEIIPSPRMSFNAKFVEEITIPITVVNLNKTHYSYTTEVTVLSVTLLSKHWKFMKQLFSPKYINLHAQESCHIVIKAERVNLNKSIYSTLALTSDRKLLDNIAEACLAFAKKTEIYPINLFEDPEIAQNFKGWRDGILGIQWQALVMDATHKRIVNGQTHVALDIIRRKKDPYEDIEEAWMLTDFSSLFEETRQKKKAEEHQKALQNQLAYNLEYPSKIEHDFTRRNLCTVKVILHLHSLVDNQLAVTINALEPVEDTSSDSSQLYCVNASGAFSWVGKAKIILAMKPLQTETVDMFVALPSPGVYDLGAHVQVFCQDLELEDTKILQTSKIHSALVVTDINTLPRL